MRYAAKIEYDGTNYHGWQYQTDDVITVQAVVEQAFSAVADHPLRVVCAGRTDAGVHATGQIIHFDSDAERTERAWTFGANANLPHDIAVHWVKPVADEFHARFSAIARRYCYTIYNSPIRPAIKRQSVTWQCLPLDAHLMQEAANYLLGQHDFTSFRAKQCQAKSPIKTVEFLNVRRINDDIILDIKADAFLHHMVRNIVGVLMAIGAGKQPVTWMHEVLKAQNRADGGITALPHGLCLTEVYYHNNGVESV